MGSEPAVGWGNVETATPYIFSSCSMPQTFHKETVEFGGGKPAQLCFRWTGFLALAHGGKAALAQKGMHGRMPGTGSITQVMARTADAAGATSTPIDVDRHDSGIKQGSATPSPQTVWRAGQWRRG